MRYRLQLPFIEGGGTVFYILDTSSLIFMTILHFKNVLIGSPEIFIKCPSHRTSKWQNRNLYVNLSGFNALAFLAAALQILFPFFLGVLKHLFLHVIKEAFQHQSSRLSKIGGDCLFIKRLQNTLPNTKLNFPEWELLKIISNKHLSQIIPICCVEGDLCSVYDQIIVKQNYDDENQKGYQECASGGQKFLGSPLWVVMLSPVIVLHQDALQKMIFSGS